MRISKTGLNLCFSEGRVAPEMRRQLFAEGAATDLDRLESVILDTIAECALPKAFLQAQALDQVR